MFALKEEICCCVKIEILRCIRKNIILAVVEVIEFFVEAIKEVLLCVIILFIGVSEISELLISVAARLSRNLLCTFCVK